ncbi:hypothetical protein WJ69_22880 [Burkholderia ubonensis]|uniref:LPD38 domain-containing protein n=1 Tax=Burkholderia ubonensis TaxID=101571 RepID=UPI0007590FAC|nr:LPD38 domain-containing protein [Burkholderia ubonensis]KVO05548.1 hypothetical protein WJ69_22880 [Burkholderia ubonensis]
MPDTLNPYNVATEDTAGRLRALGVLTPYEPPPIAAYGLSDQAAPSAMPAQAGSQQVGPAAPSWNAYKSANGYDATDYTNRQQLWDTYRNNVIPDIAAAHGEDANTLRSFFDQQYAADKPKAPTRTMLQAANDTAISAGNAIFGGIKSVSDLVDPSSGVSHWLGERIKEGHQQYSPVMQDEEKRREREIADAQARGDSGIAPALSYYVRNPLQGAAEAAGMIAPIAATGGVAGAAGLGARGALAANTLLGGAMGAGMVRGSLFDRIGAMSDGDLMAQSPQYAQLRQAGMSESDAKQQLGTAFVSNLPEIAGAGALNAVGARFGPVERALAGAPVTAGRAAATALEAGWMGAQAGGTQLASNLAARGALPNQSLSEGVGTAAATGALLGGVTGAALGGSRGRRPEATPVDASADAAAQGQDAAAPVLALPAPTYRLGGPDAPPAAQGFTIEGSAYHAVPEDVTAALGTLPKVYNRQWAADYLTSALRNGTLEDAARQQNSIGRAAQALLARVRERVKPRQLEAPEAPAALPSPDMPDVSGATIVDAAGSARQPTYQESADARAARQSALDSGLSADVRAAQEARTRSADVPPAADRGQRSTDAGAPDAPSAPLVSAASATDGAAPSAGDGRSVVLQNRDRASAGAIGQMNAIAANPDAGRLSFSRDFANGAPVVEANPGVAIPADQLGRQDFSVAADGRRIPVQYAVVDADTLLPSNSADGVPNAGYAQGEPNRMRAIAGNGRVAALQSAYERGTAGSYRTGIGADAALTGISPDVIAKMHNPVLVRVMPREAVTHDIGDVSNTAGTAALSPVEQASTDAQRVNLDALDFTDAGEPTPDSVRAFVQSMPVGERVGLLNPDGSPTRQAIDRLMSATFQRAYGDPELVRLYAQATDPEARTVLGGMASAAGAMARLDGAGDLDVRPLVTDAARLAVNARRSGVKLQDFARQGDIAMSPDARVFVRLFAENVRSGKRIGEALQRIADFAHNEVTKPSEDMFGSVERATRGQILENVNDTARPQDMGVTLGGEPAESGAVRQAPDAGRRADARPVEEGGAARSGEAARPGREPAESLEQRRARIGAEMESIEARARERERSGDAEGLPSRTGYSIGDRELVTDWMTAAERDRYHELRTQLPTAGEEQQAAAARVRAKVAARRARGDASGNDGGPLLTNPTPTELRARDEQQRARAAADTDARRAADQHAQADEQAKDFRLTGSDRDADRAAANGQHDLTARERDTGEPHDPYTDDLFGTGGSHIDRLSPGPLFDTHTAAAVQSAPDGQGRFAVSVGSRRVETIRSGFDRLTSADVVAHALAPLRRNPQENMVALVTDANGRPLEILRHQVGDIAAVGANAGLLVGSTLRVPDGAHVWIVHNHPSGRADLSGADKNMARHLQDLYRGTRLKYEGLLAIGRREFGYTAPGGAERVSTIPPAVRRHAIDITERVFKRTGNFGDPVHDPAAAARVTRELSNGESGVVLLNTQHAPVAFVPMPVERMARLRDTGGADTLFQAVDRANAPAALVQLQDRGAQSVEAAKNMARLGARLNLRVLDAFDQHGNSLRATGRLDVNPGENYFSRSAQKSVDANIKRGRAAMNRALVERRDVSRAMHRSDLGWVDFVWGDDKKGLQHIIHRRTTSDGMSRDEAVRFISTDLIDTIARGETIRRADFPKDTANPDASRLVLRHNDAEVILTRRKGGNGWVLSGYVVDAKKGAGGRRAGDDASTPTLDTPTRFRDAKGAASETSPRTGDERSIPPPREADLSRRQAPPREGLSVSDEGAAHESLGALRDAWEARGLKVDVSEGRDGTITLSRIVVPEGERQSGVGSAFMRDLTHYADERGARIALSPSTDFGASSVGRLRDFYRRHGFVENKGRNRDFEVSESMYREPGGADLSRGDGMGMTGGDVRRAIGDDTFNHNVDVYDTIDDAPDYVREQARREGADDVEGFFDPRTNRVALIAENIAHPDRARAVARHELIGHYGIENMVGRTAMRDLATKVSTAERLGNKVFREIGAEVDRTQPGLSADRRAREMIAMMAERNMHNSIVRRVLDGVRQFLNRIGLLRGDTTDAEIAGMLRDAQAYMREQGRPSIADPEAATAFAKARQSDARGPMFSRAGAARGPVPMAGHEPTVVERMREMWRDPDPTKDAARTLLSEGASAPQPKWLEDATTALFDYRNPIEQVIRRTGDTAAGRDFRNTMRTFEAATQKTLHDFESSRVDPMLGALRDAWKSDFEKLPWYKEHGYRQFLQDVGTIGNLVKHGRERNAEIARKTAGKDQAGSGATNEEIAAFEQHFRQSTPGLIEFYEGLYRDHLKPMLDYRDQTLRDAGLLTPEMETGRPKYDWYLPLYGDPGEVDTGGAPLAGGGASLKSPKDKQAMGRSGTLADNPLQNVLVAADSAIRNAGMQQFKKDFVRFVKDAPGAKALMSAKVNEAPNFEIFEKYVDKDGIVKQRVKPNAAMSPDAIVLREGDTTTIVHVGNQKVMDALKGANRAQIDGLLGLPMRATRVLSRVYTTWNPMFPLMNKLRDVQSMASLVMADAPTADKLGAVRRMLANNATFMPQWRVKPGSEYHRWLERFEELGGATQYTDLFNDDIMKNIENEFGKLAGVNTKYKAKAAAQKVGDFVDRVNEHMEMTSRVSLFKALVESGVPERDAVLYAKNTMNFETKGRLGQQLAALYTFAGPALFDARRMSQALRTPRGAAMMLAQFALMYGMYGALKAMGGQDDDGVDRLNKVPLSQAGRFLTMIDPSDPDGRGFKFPVGFGFQRIALTLAAATHRYADGIDDTGTFLSNVLKDGVLSNFSAVEPTDIDPSKDLSQWAMQQFAPSVAKPLLQLALNQTGQGNPIHKPDEWTGNKLHFQQGWPQTSGLFRGLAKQLYDSVGIDVYPETLQFLLRSYGGGGALDAIKAIDLMGEKADVDKHLSDLPLVRSFGSGPVPQDMTQFRQNSTDIDRLTNERKYAEQEGKLDEFDSTNPGVVHRADLMKAANAEIKALYKERQEALADEDPAERQRRALEVNRRIRAVQMRANRAYKEVMANAG